MSFSSIAIFRETQDGKMEGQSVDFPHVYTIAQDMDACRKIIEDGIHDEVEKRGISPDEFLDIEKTIRTIERDMPEWPIGSFLLMPLEIVEPKDIFFTKTISLRGDISAMLDAECRRTNITQSNLIAMALEAFDFKKIKTAKRVRIDDLYG